MYVTMVIAAMLTTAVGSQASESRVFPYQYREVVLPNGLQVILIPMPSQGLVSFYTIVRVGSRDEVEPGKSGFAHFFEHMMFRGTKKYPQNEYNRLMTRIGAKANAFTTDDLTAYHQTFAAEDLELVMELESDRFQNLQYSVQAFQTEAGAVYGEYRKSVTQPFFLLFERLKDTAYDRHTYKHTTLGFEADIKAMPHAYQFSLEFFKRFYRPDNTALLVVGDIDPDATLKLIEKYYGNWQRGYAPPQVPVEPPQTAERTAEVAYPGKTLPILAIAYKGDAFDPDNGDYVAALLLEELAFGTASPLYRKLIIQEQKVEMLAAHVPINRDPPLYTIVAMVKRADDVSYVRDEIYRTLEQLERHPPEAARLRDVKRRWRYSLLMELDAPDKVAGSLARIIAVGGGMDALERLFAGVERVTAEDVSRAASRYFTPQRRTVVVLKGQ